MATRRSGTRQAESWPEEIAKQEAFNTKYQETGELLGAYGLADPRQPSWSGGRAGPAITDGPYLETKEYIASFYLLEYESAERAEQIAADMPWADQEPVELWPILHESPEPSQPEAGLDRAAEDLLRDLAPQVLGVLVRRHGDFDACEDAAQEALLAAAGALARRGRAGQPARLADHGAARRWTDQVRSETARRRREERAAATPEPRRQPGADAEPGRDGDDTLALLLPVLPPGPGARPARSR